MPYYIDYNGKSIELPDKTYQQEVLDLLQKGQIDFPAQNPEPTGEAKETYTPGLYKAAQAGQDIFNVLAEQGGKAFGLDNPDPVTDALAFRIGELGKFWFDSPLEGVKIGSDPGASKGSGSGMAFRVRPEIADAILTFAGPAGKAQSPAMILGEKGMARTAEKHGKVFSEMLSKARKYRAEVAAEATKNNPIAKERLKRYDEAMSNMIKHLEEGKTKDEVSKLIPKDVEDFFNLRKEIGSGKLKVIDPDLEVFKKYGMYKGPDGLWRTVLSDKLAEINIGGNTFKDYLNKFVEQKLTGTTLGKLLKHDALYEAYPELKNMKVIFVSPSEAEKMGMGGAPAWFNPRKNKIGLVLDRLIDKNSGDIKQILSPVLHEAQHAIQEIEGMAKGGGYKSDEYLKNVLGKDIAKLFDVGAAPGNNFDYLVKIKNNIPSGGDAYWALYGEKEARAVERMLKEQKWDAPASEFFTYKDKKLPDIVVQHPNWLEILGDNTTTFDDLFNDIESLPKKKK